MPTLSLLDLIDEAFERIQINPRAGYDMRSAKRSLDILLSDWTNRGLNLWTVEQATYPAPIGTTAVLINPTAYDVMDAVIRDTSVTPPFDLALSRVSPTDFLNIPFKTMRGTPSQFTITRTHNSTTMNIWMVPDRDCVLLVNQLKVIPSLTGYTSSIEIPPRFQAALISGLAHQLSLKKNPQRSAELKAYYEEDFQRAADEERDRSSLYVVPDMS
jgi:hypothetical protein